MIIFAKIDDLGFPVAFYNDDINDLNNLPAGCVEISEEQWRDCLNHQGRRKWDGTQFIEYTPPTPPPTVPQQISDRQFFQQLAILGIITQDEALASNAAVIPPSMLALISGLPEDQKFGAKMLVSGATVFERNHPLTLQIGAAYGWTSEQIDQFFIAAGLL